MRKCSEILYAIEFYINSKGNFAIIKISQCMFSERWKMEKIFKYALTKVGYFGRNSLKERQKSIKSDA